MSRDSYLNSYEILTYVSDNETNLSWEQPFYGVTDTPREPFLEVLPLIINTLNCKAGVVHSLQFSAL